MNSVASLLLWTSTAVLTGALFAARAAEQPATPPEEKPFLPWEKGSIELGGFIAVFDSSVGFGVNRAAGVTFDGEELFGLDRSLIVFRADAMYRPGKSRRHQFDVSYASYHRSGSADLTQEIEINGITYPVGANVDSVLNFDIIRGTYSYALLQDDRMRIAVGLGIYAVPLRFGLEIETTGGESTVEGANTTLPLPSLSLRGEFQLVPKLFLNGSINAMYLEVSDFTGSLLDTNLGLEYRPWRHFGLGLGYGGLSVDLEAKTGESDYLGADFTGHADVRYHGLILYGKLSF